MSPEPQEVLDGLLVAVETAHFEAHWTYQLPLPGRVTLLIVPLIGIRKDAPVIRRAVSPACT